MKMAGQRDRLRLTATEGCKELPAYVHLGAFKGAGATPLTGAVRRRVAAEASIGGWIRGADTLYKHGVCVTRSRPQHQSIAAVFISASRDNLNPC